MYEMEGNIYLTTRTIVKKSFDMDLICEMEGNIYLTTRTLVKKSFDMDLICEMSESVTG